MSASVAEGVDTKAEIVLFSTAYIVLRCGVA